MSTSDKIEVESPIAYPSTFQTTLGFVPALVRAQSLVPRLMEAQASLESATRLRDGLLSRLQKERILLAIASDRRDLYSKAEHCSVLSALGEPDAQIDALLVDSGDSALSEADLAAFQFDAQPTRLRMQQARPGRSHHSHSHKAHGCDGLVSSSS